MQSFDLHMHTTYCDGKDTPEKMILSAIDKSLETVGISGHSFTWFDTSYCMSPEGTEKYIDEIRLLKEKYTGSIRVLLGTELDYWAEIDVSPYDYLIGSSHYLFPDTDAAGGSEDGPQFIDIDYTPEILADGAKRFYGGDMIALCEAYYEQMGDIVRRTDCDIVGHFDLVTKFNDCGLIDTEDPRYIAAWQRAVDRIFEDCKARYDAGFRNRLEEPGILKAGDKPVFEINTGAMAKGYRSTPYPAPDQIDYIRSKGGVLIFSSDSHRTDTICYGFDTPVGV